MLSVRERGETVATLRWIHVRLMETLAAWVPTTPEMEVKLLFGAHIWDVAQHADALGKRTYELRMPLQHSLRPSEPYLLLLADLGKVKDTAERLASFYDGVLVALAARYRDYLSHTDSLLDAPSVRIFEYIGREQMRMIGEYRALVAELPALALNRRERVSQFLSREASIDRFIAPRPREASAGA